LSHINQLIQKPILMIFGNTQADVRTLVSVAAAITFEFSTAMPMACRCPHLAQSCGASAVALTEARIGAQGYTPMFESMILKSVVTHLVG
jgi:hypothetical protein